MRNLLHNRFQLQLLFALIAAASVAALAVELAANAIRHAQSYVLSDTSKALTQAQQELAREYRLRRRGDSSWTLLPSSARDITLRAISQTVLSAYPGIEGGFAENAQLSGYSYPTHDGSGPKTDVPLAEKSAIEDVLSVAKREGSARKVLRGRHDIVVISAENIPSQDAPASAWVMKRLAGQAETAPRTENILLTALVAAALLSAAGVLATGVGLNRGVAQITTGLSRLDRDFSQQLPHRRDELGRISAAINEMARTRRRLEAEVRREDRARLIGTLIGRIAHEMRNPLNSMRLSLQMLQQRLVHQRLQPDDFQLVLDEVDRINKLLSDLLAFQQPRPPRLESCKVRNAVEQSTGVVRPQAEKQSVHLTSGGDLDHSALADHQFLSQILVNLMLNAVDVSKPGATIQVNALARDGKLAIEIADEGPGLTADQREHLFEPFYTTKSNGHGLGLSVSRELARSMGAELTFHNRPTGGTAFILQLERT